MSSGVRRGKAREALAQATMERVAVIRAAVKDVLAVIDAHNLTLTDILPALTQDTPIRTESGPDGHRRPTLRELTMVKHYIANGGNGAKAIMETPGYHPSHRASASNMASEVLARPHVQSVIQSELVRQGLDTPVQISALAQIVKMQHRSKTTTTTTTYGKDGKERGRRVRETVKEPTAADVGSAIALAVKASGQLDATRDVVREESRELRKLYAQIAVRPDKGPLRGKSEGTTGQDSEEEQDTEPESEASGLDQGPAAGEQAVTS